MPKERVLGLKHGCCERLDTGEVVAWGFLAGSMFRAGAERTLRPGFLVPAIAHAVLRACFWSAQRVGAARD